MRKRLRSWYMGGEHRRGSDTNRAALVRGPGAACEVPPSCSAREAQVHDELELLSPYSNIMVTAC